MGLVRARVEPIGCDAARRRAGQALDWVGFTPPAWRPLGTLSSEQRARATLAMALVRVPGLLLWPPPVGLAPGTRTALCETIHTLALRWETVALIAGDEAMPGTKWLQMERLG